MSAVDTRRYTHRLRVLAFLFRLKVIHGTFSNFLFRNSLVHILAPNLMTMWHACVCVCVCVYEYIRNTHLCLNFIYLLIVQKTKTQRELGLIVPHDQQQREFFYFVFFLGELAKRLWLCNIPTKHPTGFRCRYQFRFRCRFWLLRSETQPDCTVNST